MLRVGKVKYLNTLPLFYRFTRFEIVEGHPSELVDKLRKGEIDAGIVSSVEYLLNRDRYLVIPEVSISSKGRVCSVLLLSSKSMEDIKKIKLTSNSLTSKYLLRFIMQEGYGKEFVEVEENYDALLSIGDEAIELKRDFPFSWDLGEEWFKLTGLPFVFALFLVRKDIPLMFVNQLRAEIRNSLTAFYRDLKGGNLKIEGFSNEFINSYFGSCISYSLGEEELEGLKKFFSYAGSYLRHGL
jgi:chorismate dehydratase